MEIFAAIMEFSNGGDIVMIIFYNKANHEINRYGVAMFTASFLREKKMRDRKSEQGNNSSNRYAIKKT